MRSVNVYSHTSDHCCIIEPSFVIIYQEEKLFFGGGGVVGVCGAGGIGDVEHMLMAIQVMLHFRCTWCTEGDNLQENSDLECPDLRSSLEESVDQILI